MGGSGRHQKKTRILLWASFAATSIPTYALAEQKDAPPETASPENSGTQVKNVVVSGPPRNKSRASSKDVFAASTLIPREELSAAGSTSAAVAARVAGVSVARTGTGADFASAALRGSTSAQTPVYLAGIRLNDDVTGTTDLSTIPLWMIDRAEIFRGNAPGQSDQFGLGGAILFEPLVPKDNRITAGIGAGSFGEFSLWTTGAASGDSASALFGIRRDRADNNFLYLDHRLISAGGTGQPLRTRENADSESYDAWAAGQFLVGPARVRTIFNAFDREQGLAGDGLYPALYSRARMRRMLGGLNVSLPCASRDENTGQSPCGLTLTTAAFISNNRIDDPYTEILLNNRFQSAGIRFSQSALLQYDVMDNLRIGIQASQSSESANIDRSRGNDLRARRWVSRAALSAQAALRPWISVMGLGAIECHFAEGQDALAANNGGPCGAAFAPQGRLGIRLKPSEGTEILANAGHYVRVPTLAELYGSSFFVAGNPGLTPETGYSADIGFRGYTRGIGCASCQGYLDVFAFSRWVTNIIVFKQSNFGLVRPHNEGEARVLGIEASGWLEFFQHLHLGTSATLMEPRITTPGSPYQGHLLPYRSQAVVSPHIEAFGDISERSFYLNRLALGLRLLYRSLRYDDQGNIGILPAQTTVDAEATAVMMKRRLTLRLAARNLFNEYQFDFVGFPLPGRSFHAVLEGVWPGEEIK